MERGISAVPVEENVSSGLRSGIFNLNFAFSA